MNEPIRPVGHIFTNENQRKHSYIHACDGCLLIASFIPADDKGRHLDCPAGPSMIGWYEITREEWESYTEEQKDAVRAENAARLERLQAYFNSPAFHENSNKPHCPTCNSTKVSKISSASKAMSILAWGIFSNKRDKQFKCDNCGYMW